MAHREVLCHGIYIDELLYPIFNKIIPMGLKTLYSCQGNMIHNNELIDGYITFKTIADLLIFLKLIHYNYKSLRIVYEHDKQYVNYDELLENVDNCNVIRCVVEFKTLEILNYFS